MKLDNRLMTVILAWQIARKVAEDRVISTAGPDARPAVD
jgi:hypothetical protein